MSEEWCSNPWTEPVATSCIDWALRRAAPGHKPLRANVKRSCSFIAEHHWVIGLACYITDVSLNYAQVIGVQQKVLVSQRHLSLKHPGTCLSHCIWREFLHVLALQITYSSLLLLQWEHSITPVRLHPELLRSAFVDQSSRIDGGSCSDSYIWATGSRSEWNCCIRMCCTQFPGFRVSLRK